jgi:hypothetical protein
MRGDAIPGAAERIIVKRRKGGVSHSQWIRIGRSRHQGHDNALACSGNKDQEGE